MVREGNKCITKWKKGDICEEESSLVDGGQKTVIWQTNENATV